MSKLSRYDKTHLPHLIVLKEKVKARSDMQVTSPTNFAVYTICRLVCKSVAGLKYRANLKHHN